MKKLFFLISFILSLFLITSCSKHDERIALDENFSWTYCDIDSLPEDVGKLEFFPLKNLGKRNLQKLAGSEGKYVWVKCEFEIPESLKNKDLAFFVSYIHFADKVWINGAFSGEYGRFPPDFFSSQYQAHFYPFPKENLNQEGKNTILLKIYCLGRAEISNHLFVGEYSDTKYFYDIINFVLSIVYMLFEGGMFATTILYMIMFFMEKRKHKEYLAFSLTSYFTMVFASMFCANYLPWFFTKSISFLIAYKFLVVSGFFAGEYFLAIFMMHFLDIEIPKWARIIGVCYLGMQLIVAITAPSYLSLMRRAGFLSGTIFVWLGGTIIINIIAIFDKKKSRKAKILFIGILPLVIGAIIDIIVHGICDISDSPFYMYFGWQISIICYLAVLCVRFTRNSLENIYLNKNLQKEVEFQTNKLKTTALQLESELGRARKDLQMASIVQQQSFSLHSKTYAGWDIAVSYQPLSEVSGDMYDFYSVGSRITGFSIFDVSGHGIAASLITMLSKNIVYQVFKKIYNGEVSSSSLLEEINQQIVAVKGNVENYLTGLLFQIENFDSNHKCKLQMANAGHPHPYMYCVESNQTLSIVPTDSKKQYGALGISGMDVSYQNIQFEMGIGDVLVCFTDGIIEAENTEKKQFGRENIKKIINNKHNESAHSILDTLISEMNGFATGKPREDDITVIVLKRTDPNLYSDDIEEL